MIVLHQPYSELLNMPVWLLCKSSRVFFAEINDIFASFKNQPIVDNKKKNGKYRDLGSIPRPEEWDKLLRNNSKD